MITLCLWKFDHIYMEGSFYFEKYPKWPFRSNVYELEAYVK